MNKRNWRPFEEAREFVRKLGLRSSAQWKAYCRKGEKPSDIPSRPDLVYDAFEGYGDWLGSGAVSRRYPRHRSFEEAREYVRKLGLKNVRAWQDYCNSGKKPSDIPSTPDGVYDEFKGYGDWLGTGNVRNQDRSHRPFKEAREYVRRLGLKTKREWEDYCKWGGKPKDIPRTPRQVYGSEFQGFGDWLGTGNPSKRYYKPRSFEEARDFARGLGLKSYDAWRDYCASGKLDFSQLGVKGIDTLFTPLHNKRSLLLPTPADHGDRALGSLQATPLNARLPTRPLFS